MSPGIRDPLMDRLMEAYLEWCEESGTVAFAYRRWSSAPPDDATVAFAAYVAALDREERASAEYARLFGRSRAVQARDRRLDEWLGEAA
jgi:hypothetical protein